MKNQFNTNVTFIAEVFMNFVFIPQPLPFTGRPLYCGHMTQLVICFTGFVEKDELKRLAELVHHMGGSVRKDFSTKVTHLVANATNGNKYRVNCTYYWFYIRVKYYIFL